MPEKNEETTHEAAGAQGSPERMSKPALARRTVLAGAGVGGGSLNYANTLYVPPAPFFRDRQWADITDWQRELAPYYDQARRMLGVRTNPTTTEADIDRLLGALPEAIRRARQAGSWNLTL